MKRQNKALEDKWTKLFVIKKKQILRLKKRASKEIGSSLEATKVTVDKINLKY